MTKYNFTLLLFSLFYNLAIIFDRNIRVSLNEVRSGERTGKMFDGIGKGGEAN